MRNDLSALLTSIIFCSPLLAQEKEEWHGNRFKAPFFDEVIPAGLQMKEINTIN